jgi:outer membrane protein
MTATQLKHDIAAHDQQGLSTQLRLLPCAIATAALLATSPALMAHEAGDLILRVGAANVQPNESSSVINTINTGALAGTGVGVGNNTQLGINLVYMLTDSWAIEVLASTPFEHDLTASGLAQYGFNTTDLGSTEHLPPTVSALYYFGSSNATIRPFIGAGINYTTFFEDSLSSSARAELGANDLELDDSFGLSFRAGIDWQLNDRWLLNASAWNIDLDTNASFNSSLGRVRANVDIDPWVYMISLGYKF